MKKSVDYQAVVIGGGFYGCSVALHLNQYYPNVLIIEKENQLLTRASLVNQARVHNGYHYPRNIVTAYRSFINFPRFVQDFKECVVDDFTKLYAIARQGSKVNAYQFFEMFRNIGTPVEVASSPYKALFNQNLIEEVFLVKEYAFDASILRESMARKLQEAGVTIAFETEVKRVVKSKEEKIYVELNDDQIIQSDFVYNCTYSQINKLLDTSGLPLLPFKHELTEMALIDMPDELKKIGITVMDGPFFSCMPYPSEQLHSLSHVRYTPHMNWTDYENLIDGYALLEKEKPASNYLFMLRDAERYMPLLSEARYVKSIYEIKTILTQNESDDGRPILHREHYGFNNFSNIMGGKIDNIYDIIEQLETKRGLAGKEVAATEVAEANELEQHKDY